MKTRDLLKLKCRNCIYYIIYNDTSFCSFNPSLEESDLKRNKVCKYFILND